VLVVDDDHVFADALTHRLSHEPGVRAVDPVYSADEARNYLRGRRPDVVLLDYNLDDGTHEESSLRLLQEITAEPDPPAVLMLSGSQNVSDIAHAVDLGAGGWLVKGITAPDLLAAVDQALDGELVLPAGAVGSLVRYLLEELHRRGMPA
jgi:two-component system nitrate/nitrite response regulator NarL